MWRGVYEMIGLHHRHCCDCGEGSGQHICWNDFHQISLLLVFIVGDIVEIS